jgi:hypothetical protein
MDRPFDRTLLETRAKRRCADYSLHAFRQRDLNATANVKGHLAARYYWTAMRSFIRDLERALADFYGATLFALSSKSRRFSSLICVTLIFVSGGGGGAGRR